MEEPPTLAFEKKRIGRSKGAIRLNVTVVNDKQAAFHFAMERFHTRQLSVNNSIFPKDLTELNLSHEYQGQLLNSIRIPKAGSSHLSVQARALAGCHPDGYPCCSLEKRPRRKHKFTRDCPRYDLFCPQVTGCVDHRPKYNGSEPAITAIRDPTSRLLSAFFYHYPHRPKPVGNHDWVTFQEYIQNDLYRNVLTKMLNGAYAYHPFQPEIHTVEEAKSRMCRMLWFSLSDFQVVSSLLLYESGVFQRLAPNPVVFDLPAASNGEAPLEHSMHAPDALRQNQKNVYRVFKNTLFQENNGTELVAAYNEHDLEVYVFARRLFCSRLKESGLMEAAGSIAVDEIQACNNMVVERPQDYCPKHTIS